MFISTPFRIALILFLFTFFDAFSSDIDKSLHVSKTPLWVVPIKEFNEKLNQKEIKNGFYISLYEEQFHVELKSTYKKVIREIVTDAGVQNGSQISVEFNPAYEKIEFHDIVVWRNNIPIKKLDLSKFKIIQDEEELSKFLYRGLYTAYLILDDIRKGDRIEYSYTTIGQNPIFEDKLYRDIYLQGDDPIVHLYSNIIFSPNRKLQTKSFNNLVKETKSVQDGLNCYAWECFLTKPVTVEEYEPSWYNKYQHVQISEYENWNSVALWVARINSVPVKTSAELSHKISEFKKKSTDQLSYMQQAVRFVQDEIRYMGIEIGEYSHRANSPDQVLKQRYGDCKDKSLLLCTLLKANSIDANIAYVNTYTREKTADQLPSPLAFNHAIVTAFVNGKFYWIDPTISFQRGPVYSVYCPNYGKALIGKVDQNKLTDVTSYNSGPVKITENFKLLKNSNDAILDVISEYSLSNADDIRYKFATSSQSEIEKSYLDYYVGIYNEVETKSPLKLIDNDDLNIVTVYEEYKIKNFWTTDSITHKQTCSFYAQLLKDALRQTPANKRQAPISLTFPYNLDYTISIETPADWNIEDDNINVDATEYSFSYRVKYSDRHIDINFNYKNLTDNIPAYKAANYTKDLNRITDHLNYTLTWNKKAVLDTSLNDWALLTTIGLIILLGFGGWIFYKYSYEPTDLIYSSQPIGGWLVLFAIGISVNPFILLYQFLNIGFLKNTMWISAINLGPKVIAVIAFEFLGNLILIVSSVVLAIMFYERRNTFPRLAIAFLAFSVSFHTIDFLALKLISSLSSLPATDTSSTLIQHIIKAAIWIPYFLHSTRVQETFVFPHSSFPLEDWHKEQEGKISKDESIMNEY